ncbi:MAG: SymE family type I addiction module toxin [Eubacterium sp.]
MTQKKMKVQYRSRATAHGYTDMPMIQMTGRWLENLGYRIGDPIMVEYDDNGIRIRPLTEAEQATAARDELELSIRRKEKELKVLQKQIDAGNRELSMVAEPGNRFSDTQVIQ